MKLPTFGTTKKVFHANASSVLTKITSGKWATQVLAVLAQRSSTITVLTLALLQIHSKASKQVKTVS
jgi:hypothetical protein